MSSDEDEDPEPSAQHQELSDMLDTWTGDYHDEDGNRVTFGIDNMVNEAQRLQHDLDHADDDLWSAPRFGLDDVGGGLQDEETDLAAGFGSIGKIIASLIHIEPSCDPVMQIYKTQMKKILQTLLVTKTCLKRQDPGHHMARRR